VANACRVTCISRAADRITALGCTDANGTFRTLTLEEVVRSIEAGEQVFYVTLEDQSYLVIVGTDRSGNKYVKTVRDDDDYTSLLELADCP
jgi:Protein of unknown function (DUF3892)